MSEQNAYFPHLFSPIQIGTKTMKNRIEAAPALFAFLHLVEAPFSAMPGRDRSAHSVCWKQRQPAAQAVLCWAN